MNFSRKLFSFFTIVTFISGCYAAAAQEINAQKYVQLTHNKTLLNFCVQRSSLYKYMRETSPERPAGNLPGEALQDPYKEYLKNLPLGHKIWNAFGASNFGYGLRSIGRSLPSNPYQLPGPVVEEFHDLLKEAQTVVGLSKERHLPAGLLNPEGNQNVVASAMPSAIIFNEIHLHGRSYGYKRFVVFHEAIHAKYDHDQDELVASLVGWGATMAFIGIINAFVPKNKNEKLDFGMRMAAGLMVSYFVTSRLIAKLSILVETRADTEGALASRCGLCVSEMAESRGGRRVCQDRYYRDGGYLTGSELDAIADKLRSYSCDYHKKQKNVQKHD